MFPCVPEPEPHVFQCSKRREMSPKRESGHMRLRCVARRV